MNKAAGIVLAGGYGYLSSPNKPKVLESLTVDGGLSLLGRVLQLSRRELGLFTFIVLNKKYRQELFAGLAPFQPIPGSLLIQVKRIGTAGAVELVLRKREALLKGGLYFFDLNYVEHVLVLYADMPLWQADTLKQLLAVHLQSPEKPAVTMFTIKLDSSAPEEVARYGRILRNERGEIVAIREPYDLKAEEAAKITHVNPSAWVFDRRFLEANLAALPLHDKGDGFSPERWLPDLIPVAASHGRKVQEIVLDQPWQAIGVNTAEELDLVRSFWSKLQTKKTP